MSTLLLSAGHVEDLADRVCTALERRGIQISHPGMLSLLDGAGARVDRGSGTVRFPRRLQERALAAAPRSFRLGVPPGREGASELVLPPAGGSSGPGFYLCTGTGARGWLDPETGEHRPLLEADVRTWGRLASVLDNVDLCAFPTPTDAPPESVDVHALWALLESSARHVWIQPHTEASLPFLLELCAARAGGREAFRHQPCASIIACALTPFRVKSMDVEVMLQASRMGMPVHVSSLPVIGGTSPLSTLGTVLVAAIEVLAMLIMVQVTTPGAPVVALATALGMDMATGRAVKACPEAMMANAACAEFMSAAYRIPVHTAGLTTDAFSVDAQAMIEHSLYAAAVAGAGAAILGRGGELEAAKTFSPAQLVVDDELVGALRRFGRLRGGLDVEPASPAWVEESLAWEDVLSVPAGGHFLESLHTLRHCREAFRPRLFPRQSREQWDLDGGAGITERAAARCRELLRRPGEPPAARDEMRRIVREADRVLSPGTGDRPADAILGEGA